MRILGSIRGTSGSASLGTGDICSGAAGGEPLLRAGLREAAGMQRLLRLESRLGSVQSE